MGVGLLWVLSQQLDTVAEQPAIAQDFAKDTNVLEAKL